MIPDPGPNLQVSIVDCGLFVDKTAHELVPDDIQPSSPMFPAQVEGLELQLFCVMGMNKSSDGDWACCTLWIVSWQWVFSTWDQSKVKNRHTVLFSDHFNLVKKSPMMISKIFSKKKWMMFIHGYLAGLCCSAHSSKTTLFSIPTSQKSSCP